MNIYEYLTKEKALLNQAKRTAIAENIFSGEMSLSVTTYPDTPSGMSTSSLIRNTLSGRPKSYQANPLNVPKYRQALESMATNNPDYESLRRIAVDGATAAQNQASNHQPIKKRATTKSVIVPYLAGLLTKSPLLKSKELLCACIKNTNDTESPFGVYQNQLTRKGSANTISNEVFAAWFTEARKLNQKN